jgi:geranylgeranyl diphosphate synthase type II
MIRGQALDIEAERLNSKGSLAQINVKTIHECKTGKIITWSCLAGLYATGDETTINKNSSHVTQLGEKFGLLFQIVDDLLDEMASASEIGKTPGKDKQAGKLTFISEYGVETTITMANNLMTEIDESISNLKKLGGNWLVIEELSAQLKQKLNH